MPQPLLRRRKTKRVPRHQRRNGQIRPRRKTRPRYSAWQRLIIRRCLTSCRSIHAFPDESPRCVDRRGARAEAAEVLRKPQDGFGGAQQQVSVRTATAKRFDSGCSVLSVARSGSARCVGNGQTEMQTSAGVARHNRPAKSPGPPFYGEFSLPFAEVDH